MSKNMERWDIYDADKNKTGRTMIRNDFPMKDGDYHLSVLGIVTDGKGRFLITQRKADKAWAPLSWEVPGGGVQAGETSEQAVRREVSEETGLKLDGADIPNEGPARISLIEQKPTGHGTQWLADWLNERYTKASCVVIDGRNGVDVLVEKISDTWKVKGSVIRPGVKDVIASVSTLTNALSEKEMTWYSKQEALRDSAVTSVKRSLGGGWGFGGENSTPIEAAALALWGAKQSKRDPGRKMRIG